MAFAERRSRLARSVSLGKALVWRRIEAFAVHIEMMDGWMDGCEGF